MQIKLSKKLKKLLIGFGLTSVLVFLILFLGNVQNPQLDGVRNGAESLEYLFYDMFFKVKTGKTHNLEETGDKNALNSHYDPNIFIVDIDEEERELSKELGDVLLHVIFYAKIGEEKQHFDIVDVINFLCDKLIYRHPHVFSSAEVGDAEDVIKQWEMLKTKEKDENIISFLKYKRIVPLL